MNADWLYPMRKQDSTAKTLVFFGDSITASGEYIRFIEACLRQRGNLRAELLGMGVPSETASGLSEAAHPFPRPCIHDRLNQVLESSDPWMVVACYGMNDGIYHPFSEERFDAYKEGIRRLVAEIRNKGAISVLMTPPPFDPESMNASLQPGDAPNFSYLEPYQGYDGVLKLYSEWLLSEHPADDVIDIRSPLIEHIRSKRSYGRVYSSGDGIHPNREGHRIIAQTILKKLFGLSLDLGRMPDIG